MGTFARLLPLFLLLLPLTACEKGEEGGVRTTVYDKVESATRDKAPEQPILLPPQQEEYLDVAEERLARLDRQAEVLKEKIAAMPEGARAEYDRELQDLRRQRELVKEKLNLLRDAGAEAWNEIEPALESTLTDFEQTVQALEKRLNAS